MTSNVLLPDDLFSSLLTFIRVFYELRTGRVFELSTPQGRECHYITICRALTKVIKGETTRLIINVPPRYGKAIALETPILTQKGWSTAGDIIIGDMIVGTEGWTKVTGVFNQGILPAKKVIFSDGQSVICNDDHLWNVCDRYTPKYKTMKTSEIEESLYEADGRKHWKIPLVNGEYGEVQPSINPYLLGCWLGDGHTHYSVITTMDDDIKQAFVDDGHKLRMHTHQSAGKAITYGIVDNGFHTLLRKLGLLKNKHIPFEVFNWSKSNRLALLQGLMDTDGTCGKNGQVSFTNINKLIIEGVCYLVNSLGGIYKIYTRRCGTQTINLRLPDDIKPFRLERKNQYVSKGIKCSPRRFISNILPAEDTKMVCFTVDSKDSLFAVGEGLILTHNTEIMIHFIAWALAQFPDSNFLYVSYGLGLAKKQTKTIRQIIDMPEYREVFDVRLSEDTAAQGNFETNKGGAIYAAGAGGEITGRGAGIKACNRFGGCVVIDDIHKPSEVTSATIRASINEWYYNTLQSRVNSPEKTPIIVIAQCLHEDDMIAMLKKTEEWTVVCLPALDEHNNALHPAMHTTEMLLDMKAKMSYVFAAQYQQNPLPAGGALFKESDFIILDEEPEILVSFITADTAETSKTYNDPSVFSHFGLYKIKYKGIDTGRYGLHWINCHQDWIEPKDLESEFLSFYGRCMRHVCPPQVIAIEKKNTGVTLLSTLKTIPGLRCLDIERNKRSKTDRFLEIQPYVSDHLISLPYLAKHTTMCVTHCKSITANNSHRHDDIADTLYDAIRLALIEKTIMRLADTDKFNSPDKAKYIMSNFVDAQRARDLMNSNNAYRGGF